MLYGAWRDVRDGGGEGERERSEEEGREGDNESVGGNLRSGGDACTHACTHFYTHYEAAEVKLARREGAGTRPADGRVEMGAGRVGREGAEHRRREIKREGTRERNRKENRV